MFIDLIGILLTIVIVSIRYWYIVLIICIGELLLSILMSIALTVNITQVIAGGIFTHISGEKQIIPFLAPLFILLIGVGMLDFRSIRWIDLLNPISNHKRPWPILLMKTAFLRITFIAIYYI